MERWIALLTLGCFCVLASYSYGTIQPGRWHKATPVVITREEACADDWLCQLQHSAVYRAPRSRRH